MAIVMDGPAELVRGAHGARSFDQRVPQPGEERLSLSENIQRLGM